MDAKQGSRLVGLPARNLFASLFVDPKIETSVASIQAASVNIAAPAVTTLEPESISGNGEIVDDVAEAMDSSESVSDTGSGNGAESGESEVESDQEIYLPIVQR